MSIYLIVKFHTTDVQVERRARSRLCLIGPHRRDGSALVNWSLFLPGWVRKSAIVQRCKVFYRDPGRSCDVHDHGIHPICECKYTVVVGRAV